MTTDLSRRTFLTGTAAGFLSASFPRLALAKSGEHTFELRATKTPVSLAGDKYAASDLWLYNGETPGPEIQVTQGDRVRVRFINELDEPTSVHWHGIRIDNKMDGVAGLTQDPVQPGGTFDYDFIVPDAGTFWYHAHNKSWEQVARGLYGPLVVDEREPTFDRAHDLTLVIDDWRLNVNGILDTDSLGFLGDWSLAGRLGGWLTVNGQSEPTFRLQQNESYRLRLINAANARIMLIDPNAINAQIIALDGFPLAAARTIDDPYVPLLPAQRMDLLVTPREPGEILLNDLSDYGLASVSGRKDISLARFDVQKNANAETVKTNVKLPLNEIAEPDLRTASEVELKMQGGAMGRMGRMMHNGKMMQRGDFEKTGQFWSFNGIANLGTDPLFKAKRGETIVLTTVNETGWPHGIHLHGHHFQVIEQNGKRPTHIDWRDTFTITRDETIKIAFVADNPGKWLLHCHMLEHAAAGMRTWFEVV